MVKSKNIALKPAKLVVAYQRFSRYLYIGAFLHFVAVFGIYLFLEGTQELLVYQSKPSDIYLYMWIVLAWFGFWLPFFAELDAYSRYQNYKLIKDKLFVNGFDNRLIRPLMYSKCQRIAILVAAKDLKINNEVNAYFYKAGYRWYHFLPDLFIKNPLILFHKKFWDKILFTRYYKLQNFYW